MLGGAKILTGILLIGLSLGSANAATDLPDAKPIPAVDQTLSLTVLEREKAALNLIQYPWQELKYEIVFLPPQRGYRAMTLPMEHRIEIYVRPGDDYRLIAYDIAHELGHAIDLTLNTAATRRSWLKARGINEAVPWFGCSRCSDYATPAGDFAETFATLLLGPGHFAGHIAPSPSAAQIPMLEAFFPKATFPATTH